MRDGQVPREPPGRVWVLMQEKVRRVSAVRMPARSPAFPCFATIPRTKQRVSKRVLGGTETPFSPRTSFSPKMLS